MTQTTPASAAEPATVTVSGALADLKRLALETLRDDLRNPRVRQGAARILAGRPPRSSIQRRSSRIAVTLTRRRDGRK